MPTNRRDYYEEWYAKNRRKLRRKRKLRYLTDPEYREKAIERARAYRERKKRQKRRHTEKEEAV